MHALFHLTRKSDLIHFMSPLLDPWDMVECISHSTHLPELISASMPGSLHGGHPELHRNSTLPLNEGCPTATDARIQQVLCCSKYHICPNYLCRPLTCSTLILLHPSGLRRSLLLSLKPNHWSWVQTPSESLLQPIFEAIIKQINWPVPDLPVLRWFSSHQS